MRQSSALHFLVAAVALGQSVASQPKGDQSIAIAAVTEARDELKLVVQQLGEQQEQIDALTKEVAELRAAKQSTPVPPKTNTSAPAGSKDGSSNGTLVNRRALTSLRATAQRAEHVLVAERPRTPWWAEKQHTRGPVTMHREGGYYGETNSDPTFGRQRYYPAGWKVAPEHQPIPSIAANDGYTSYNIFAPDVIAAPPAPSPLEEAVPTLAPIIEEAPQPVETPALAAAVPESTQSSPQAPPPPASAAAPPPPGGNELRPKSDLAAAGDGKATSLKNMMGFFGPPPTGTLPNAPASA